MRLWSKRHSRWLLLLTLLALTLAALAVSLVDPGQALTYTVFRQLEPGMSLPEIERALGRRADTVDRWVEPKPLASGDLMLDWSDFRPAVGSGCILNYPGPQPASGTYIWRDDAAKLKVWLDEDNRLMFATFQHARTWRHKVDGWRRQWWQ